jgi:hypothetical protein
MGQSTTLATLGNVGNIQQTSYGPNANTGAVTRRLDINGTVDYFTLNSTNTMVIQPTNGLYMYANPLYLYAQSGGNMVFNTSNSAWNFSNTSNNTQVFSISGTGNISNSNATSNQIGGSTLSNGNLGVNTTTPVTALDVNGGVTIRNGYRPTYSNVSSGTSLTINANTYGYHFNITTSSLTGITLPTVTGSTDSNAYWVFRNNTAGYLSITFTYTTAGTTYPANPVTIPPANSLTMMVTYPSSVLGYVLF